MNTFFMPNAWIKYIIKNLLSPIFSRFNAISLSILGLCILVHYTDLFIQFYGSSKHTLVPIIPFPNCHTKAQKTSPPFESISFNGEVLERFLRNEFQLSNTENEYFLASFHQGSKSPKGLKRSPCSPEAHPVTLNTCDNSNGSGVGTFVLHDANSNISPNLTNVNISYHETLGEAQSGINQLISPYTSLNITIYSRVEDVLTGCYQTSIITLNVVKKCVENCWNGKDEDGDGLVDCEDSDCNCCNAKVPTISLN